MRLYEHAGAYAAAMALLEETDGELTPDIEAILASAGDSLVVSVDRMAAMVLETKANAASFAEEERRFAAKKAAAIKAAANLTETIRAALVVAGEKKVKGARFLVWTQASAPSVVLAEGATPESVPERFRRVKTEIDKAAIGMALKAGEDLGGVATLQASTHVRIK